MITLTTDFGYRDPFVGQMKGVILGVAPSATIVDLTHEVRPQNVAEAALVLDGAAALFPANTIHVAVVDPGVGTGRRAVAIETCGSIWIGPDNGIFTAVLAAGPDRRAVSLTNGNYHRQPVSVTFHGRDIFAPVAGHLANGTPMEALGEYVDDLVLLDLPQPVPVDEGLEIHVVHTDRFGNLVTDLTRRHYEAWKQGGADDRIEVSVGLSIIARLSRTYADVGPGEPLACFGSTDRLEIAVRNGSAAQQFDVTAGQRLRILIRPGGFPAASGSE